MKASLKRDWTLIPYVTIAMIGFFVGILDFLVLQNSDLLFQLLSIDGLVTLVIRLLGRLFQIFGLVGFIVLAFGGILRERARLDLKKKAGFNSFTRSACLEIVEDHKLVKDGVYKYIRHPLYLGEIMRNFGFVLFLSSIFGILVMGLAMVILLFRIPIEERMLIEAFGEEYRDYQKQTKKIIPYVY
ncbi:MAG: methyltransferase family protein [Candidatus Hermodarchaeota archaeon]